MSTPYAPTWVSPSTPGALSNKRGSNTGADNLALTARYASPRGDQPSGYRVTGRRTVVGGAGQVSEVVVESGVVGSPATNPLVAAYGARAVNRAATYSGRAYVAAGGYIYSAALAGANVGTWRNESSPAVQPSSSGRFFSPGQTIDSLAIVNGYMYIAIGTAISYSQIQGDGTLGAWSSGPAVAANTQLVGMSDGATFAFLYAVGGGTAQSTNVQYSSLSLTTGKPGSWTSGTVLPAARQGHGLAIDSLYNLYVVGGDDGTSAATTAYFSALNTSTGANGAWSTGGALTAARTAAALIYVPRASGIDGGNSSMTDDTFWIVGGASANAYTTAGNQVSTVYYITASSLRAVGAWTSTTALASARAGMAGFVTGAHATPAGGAGGGETPPYIAIAGGYISGATADATVFESSINNGTGGGPATTTWNSGSASALGGLTDNHDGTYDLTVSYASLATRGTSTAALSDGDAVTFSVYFVGQDGNASPTSSSVVKIGQPPTCALTIPTTSGKPSATWTYTAGAGGGDEDSYRLVVTQGGTTVFDTGIVKGSPTSIPITKAPALASGTAYVGTLTVYSTDTAMSGSSASGTSTDNFTPSSTNTPPSAPTGFSASADNGNGKITLTWTSPASVGGVDDASTNRIYYSRDGANFYLLTETAAPTPTNSRSLALMDELALGVTYTFKVSGVSASNFESAATATATATIDPAAGGYSSMLHVAGNGTTYHVGLAVLGDPSFPVHLDSNASMMFGNSAPVVRTGPGNYYDINLRDFLKTAADLKALQPVLAQERAGNALYYRDGMGTMALVALAPDQQMDYVAPSYRNASLKLVKIANTYSPSSIYPTASGYRLQVDGSVSPIDTSEDAL